MSILNKQTWKQKFSDFINRISPFDGSPLIQKTEHQELVGTDLSDSVIFSIAENQVINAPATAFNADFTSVDRLDIDTTGSGDTAFTVTFIGLSGNDSGVLKITKKSGDTFTFTNGSIAPFNSTDGQVGKSSIEFLVKRSLNDYIAYSGYDCIVTNDNFDSNSIDGDVIIDGSLDQNKVDPNANFSRFDPITGGGNLRIKVLEMGGKDLQTNGLFTVSHGLDFSKIVSAEAYIYNDAKSNLYRLNGSPTSFTTNSGAVDSINPTTIAMSRAAGEFFSTGDFSSIAENRGYVIIWYIDA